MNSYIYDRLQALIRKHSTRDPYQLLSALHVVVRESSAYSQLKGFCLISCRTTYVVLNARLGEPEKRIVAAHELGHIVLHRRQLRLAPMQDVILYDMQSAAEYEANLFAADLLLTDEEVLSLAHDEQMDYFRMCSTLYTSPDLMSFKLFSLIKRGYPLRMPLELDSRFLAQKQTSCSDADTAADLPL